MPTCFPISPGDIPGRVFPGIYPNWDNTPRLAGKVWLSPGQPPERFGAHVRRGIEMAKAYPADEQILFIKSWNEWAEGNYLEPDAEYGLARLAALRNELDRSQRLMKIQEPVDPALRSIRENSSEQNEV